MVFLDPPYTAAGVKRAGTRLYIYTRSNIDHARLFALMAERDANFLMAYDAAPEIVTLVRFYGFHAVGLSVYEEWPPQHVE